MTSSSTFQSDYCEVHVDLALQLIKNNHSNCPVKEKFLSMVSWLVEHTFALLEAWIILLKSADLFKHCVSSGPVIRRLYMSSAMSETSASASIDLHS